MLIVVAVLQVPALADVAKYASHHHPLVLDVVLIGLTIVVVRGSYALLDRDAFRRACSDRRVLLVLLAIITIAGALLYRHELHRQRIGIGATADRAMISSIQAFVHGRHMYSPHLLGDAPISPGPLWIIANAPFTLGNVYWLLIPFWLTASAIGLRWASGRGAEVTVGLILLCCSPHFWAMLGEGQDLLAISAVLVAMVALAYRLPIGAGWTIGFALLASVVATSRFIYLPWPLVLGVLIATRDRRRAVVIAGLGLSIAGGAHLLAAIGVHPYPPAHLFDRAAHNEPFLYPVLGTLAVVIATATVVVRLRLSLRTWLTALAWPLALAHAFIGLGELQGLHGHLASWEGSNYVLVGAPVTLAAVLACRSGQEVGRRARRVPLLAQDGQQSTDQQRLR